MNTPEHEPIRFSPSRLGCYLGCPKKYYFRYVEKLPEKAPSLPLTFGSNFHAALEENDLHMRDKGSKLPVEVLQASFRKKMEEARKDTYVSHKEDYDSMIEVGVKGIQAYMDFLEKDYDNFAPLFIEQEFDISLELAPVRIYGFNDVTDNEGVIIDRKTSKAKYPLETPFDKKLQPIIYTIWYRKHTGKKEKRFEYHVLIKNKKPYIQVVPVEVTEDDIFEVIKLMRDTQQKIWNNEFPTSPGWQCNYCDYNDVCPAYQLKMGKIMDKIE